MTKKKILAAGAAVALGTTGALAAGSPAQAVYSDCNAYSNVICFHEYPSFTGRVWRQLPSQFPAGCRNFAADNFNNVASTAFNLTTRYNVRIYTGSNCTGSYVFLAPGDIRSFASTDTWMNNQASSVNIFYIG